jgi:hypothetical protein
VVNYIGAGLGIGSHVARALGQIAPATSMHVLSCLIGLPLALALLHYTALRPGGLVNRLLAPISIGEGGNPAATKL